MNRFPFNRLAMSAFLMLGFSSLVGCDTEPTETSPTPEVAVLALGAFAFVGRTPPEARPPAPSPE